MVLFIILSIGEAFKNYSETFLKTCNDQNRKNTNENVENPLNFYMKAQPMYPQTVSLEPPPLISTETEVLDVQDSEISDKPDTKNVPNETKIMNPSPEIKEEEVSDEEKKGNADEKLEKEDEKLEKEEEKNDFLMENEIENTIFSKPIVTKMNANVLGSVETKPKEASNKVESPTLIVQDQKQGLSLEKKGSSGEESPHEGDPKDRKPDRKIKRRMSRDDAGVEYNQNPLDYLFPKDKEKHQHHQLDSPKKIPKECEDVKLEHQIHPRNAELSKSFSHSQNFKNEEEKFEEHKSRNPLSSSLILENKKYKVVLKKVMKPGEKILEPDEKPKEQKSEPPKEKKEEKKEEKEKKKKFRKITDKDLKFVNYINEQIDLRKSETGSEISDLSSLNNETMSQENEN